MASEYDRLFVRDMPVIANGEMSNEGEAAGMVEPENLGEPFWLMHPDSVPESRINMTHVWVKETDEPAEWVKPHVHDYDEILIWTGSNPDDPHDLGAEIYMEIDGERQIITTSGSVYIPAGTVHCPLGWNRVDRPFRFSALSLAPNYSSRR
ncbi:cupin domain-containing protein [Agromyces larvae]|uniref:Cupin domain-containing protein n=1 Tax=Agromyces larvae TaxID=2929802 RepID=A0ABY4BYR8_9MICO|nr:cupin domain-containing protein [Agromyces larvae]UOE44393.1 cupin domain-containing protein [Agromyces larvae]